MKRISLKVQRLVIHRGYERAGKRGEWSWGGRNKDRSLCKALALRIIVMVHTFPISPSNKQLKLGQGTKCNAKMQYKN